MNQNFEVLIWVEQIREMDVSAGSAPVATKETVNSGFVWVQRSKVSVGCWFVWVLKSRGSFMGYFI
jgi:hypothetical protein